MFFEKFWYFMWIIVNGIAQIFFDKFSKKVSRCESSEL